MEKEENNIFEIHSYLDLKGSPEEIMRKIIEKIPNLDDIGYAGYLEKKWLNKIILGFMLNKNGANKSYLYDLEYKNEVKNICEETIKVCEDYIDNKIHIFLFPTFDKFAIEKMGGVNGFSSWDNVILIFINFINGWKESLRETIVHELAHAVSPFYKGGDFSIGCGLILDGISEHFKDFIVKRERSPWTRAISENESWNIFWKLKNDGWLRLKNIDKYAEVFYGTGKYPLWTGYTLGYFLVKRYLKKQKEINWYELLRVDPNRILKEIM